MLNDRQYCVPLSSPKSKHESMKNGLDFHRILDSEGKLIGVLDFNNMIPVRPDVVKKIHPQILKYEGKIKVHGNPCTFLNYNFVNNSSIKLIWICR